MKTFLREIANAAYDLEAEEVDWLDAILEIARTQMNLGMGITMTTGRITAEFEPEFRNRRYRDIPYQPPEDVHDAILRDWPATWKQPVFGAEGRWIDSVSNRTGGTICDVSEQAAELGIRDIFCLATNYNGRALFMSAIVHEEVELRDRDLEIWRRVAAFVSPAFHIREHLRQAEDGEIGSMLSEVSETVQELEDEAVVFGNVWEGILSGTWSLVGIERPTPGRWRIMAHPSDEKDPRALTRRESEVLEWMVEGASNSEIARRLSASASTVGVHVKNILEKLDSTNRTELICIAGALRRAQSQATKPDSEIAHKLHRPLEQVREVLNGDEGHDATVNRLESLEERLKKIE